MAMNGGTPAWIICQDILVKAKEEFMTEALEMLERSIEEGNIAISGYVLSDPEKHQEQERNLFVLNQIVSRHDEMHKRFASELSALESRGARDAMTIRAIEKLKRFLLTLTKITTLVEYSKEIDEWINDVGMMVSAGNPSDVILGSAENYSVRKAILAQLTKNAGRLYERIFSAGERRILDDAYNRAAHKRS